MGTKGIPQSYEAWAPIVEQMQSLHPGVIIAGSYRRKKEVPNDLDVIVQTEDGKIPPEMIQSMKDLGYEFDAEGELHCRTVSKDGFQVDVYSTDEARCGSMLIHLTGSQSFNIGMRSTCKRKGYSFSQNGLVNVETEEVIASKTEEEVFAALGMGVVPPEERDDFYPKYKQYRKGD